MCKRVLIYSHDTYGLGHLRRAVRIAEALSQLDPASRPQVLIVTGSPREFAFALPDGCDVLKLPSVLKQPSGAYASRSLGLRLPKMIALRSQLILAAVEQFDPDVMLVDHAPRGMGGELLPVFESMSLRKKRPLMLLGLRDVIDDAEAIRDSWTRDHAVDFIDSIYDLVLIYGDAAMPTTAVELDLASRIRTPVRHVGLLVPALRPTSLERAKEVVVTCGGGGDGRRMLGALTEYLEGSPRGGMTFRVMTGPLLSRRRRDDLLARLESSPAVIAASQFDESLCDHISRASGVIGMGGYNSVMEILATRTPALIAARTTPRREQIVRARRLERLGLLQACELESISPDIIHDFVDSLDGTLAPPIPFDLDGLAVTASLITELLHRPCPEGKVEERIDAAC